jgi:hypothetical protein
MIKFSIKEKFEANPNYEHNLIRNVNTPLFYIVTSAAVESITRNKDTGKDYAVVAFYVDGLKREVKYDYELADFDITEISSIQEAFNLAEEALLSHSDFRDGEIA